MAGTSPARPSSSITSREGDTVQFLRYAGLVAARGARVVVEAQQSLAGLAADCEGVAAVFGSGSEPPPFDLHCPLLSLAERFATSLATIPAKIPYLVPEPAAVERWRDALGDGPGLRIGLVRAGNPGHRNDRNRSIDRGEVVDRIGVRWVPEAAENGDAVAFGEGLARPARRNGERNDVHLAKADLAAQQFRLGRRMGHHDVGAPRGHHFNSRQVSAVGQ
jgi:hypothetical protein